MSVTNLRFQSFVRFTYRGEEVTRYFSVHPVLCHCHRYVERLAHRAIALFPRAEDYGPTIVYGCPYALDLRDNKPRLVGESLYI